MNRPLLLALLTLAPAFPAAAQGPVIRDIQADIRYLADDRLGGRKLGTPGADSAADYIAKRFQRLGLQPGPQGWFQSFTVDPSAPAAIRLKRVSETRLAAENASNSAAGKALATRMPRTRPMS